MVLHRIKHHRVIVEIAQTDGGVVAGVCTISQPFCQRLNDDDSLVPDCGVKARNPSN